MKELDSLKPYLFSLFIVLYIVMMIAVIGLMSESEIELIVGFIFLVMLLTHCLYFAYKLIKHFNNK